MTMALASGSSCGPYCRAQPDRGDTLPEGPGKRLPCWCPAASCPALGKTGLPAEGFPRALLGSDFTVHSGPASTRSASLPPPPSADSSLGLPLPHAPACSTVHGVGSVGPR